MFKVLGIDQKAYGPVSDGALRQWIAEGRANAQTLVQAEGASGWRPLSDFPEFQDDLAAPRPPPPVGAPGTSGPPSGPPGKTSGMAVASLVLGILGPCTVSITAIIGLILGILAILKIDKSQGRLSGKGLAIAGTAVSGVMLLLLPIQAALFLPAITKAKSRAQTIQCINNLKQLGLGIRLHANDHDDILPQSSNWCDATRQELGSATPFQCVTDSSGLRSSYAFNSKLSGLNMDEINPQTVMLFECRGGWNVSGGPDLMVSHHRGTYLIGFADGSAQEISAAQISSLRWDP